MLSFLADTPALESLKALLEAQLGKSDDSKRAFLTLLAISVFESLFESKEDEWKLIVAKARKYLKTLEVKPEKLLKQCGGLEFIE